MGVLAWDREGIDGCIIRLWFEIEIVLLRVHYSFSFFFFFSFFFSVVIVVWAGQLLNNSIIYPSILNPL